MIYLNEWDPFAAQWLRNLSDAGEIPSALVDERDICEVKPEEVKHHAQAHWFAGVGGWPLALRLAGVPGLECWTASLPCQPFSSAGKRRGEDDERHLWPVFLDLVRECGPVRILGEQVEGAVGLGWLDRVFADLEAEGYACGSVVLGAHSLGAPHIRQRLYWGAVRLADADRFRDDSRGRYAAVAGGGGSHDGLPRRGSGGLRPPSGRLADADGAGFIGEGVRLPERGPQPAVPDASGAGEAGGVGNANGAGLRGRGRAESAESAQSNFWSLCVAIPCRDGKARRVPAEPRLQPLAHGVPRELEPLLSRLERLGYDRKAARRLLRAASRNRTGRLKGAGNAIVPQVAALFVRAFLESTQGVMG